MFRIDLNCLDPEFRFLVVANAVIFGAIAATVAGAYLAQIVGGLV